MYNIFYLILISVLQLETHLIDKRLHLCEFCAASSHTGIFAHNAAMMQQRPTIGRQQANTAQLAAIGHGGGQLGQPARRRVHITVRWLPAAPALTVEEAGDEVSWIRPRIHGGEWLRVAALLIAEKALLEGPEHLAEDQDVELHLGTGGGHYKLSESYFWKKFQHVVVIFCYILFRLVLPELEKNCFNNLGH